MYEKLSWQERSAKLMYVCLILAILALFVVLGLVLKDLLFIFIFALSINYLLAKPVNFLSKYIHNRAIAILLVLISIISLLVFIVSSIYPVLETQIINFQEVLPSIIDKVQIISNNFSENIGIHFNLITELQSFIDDLNKKNLILGSFKHSIYLITVLVMITIVSFYLLLDGNKAWTLFTELFPQKFKENLTEVKRRIDSNLNSLILGQFKVASITSSVMFITYCAIGSRFAILLGLLQMLEFIPIFGTWTAFIPAIIIITATSGVGKATIVATIYLIYSQVIRDHFIVPRIMGDAFGIHALAVILGLSLGFKAFGMIGIIVALPLIGIASAIIHYLIDRRSKEET